MSYIGESKLMKAIRKRLERYGYGDMETACAAEHIIDDRYAIEAIIADVLDEDMTINEAVKKAVNAEVERMECME